MGYDHADLVKRWVNNHFPNDTQGVKTLYIWKGTVQNLWLKNSAVEGIQFKCKYGCN